MHLLGIETSCDETAAAILHWDGTVRANIVHSQIPDHAVYGGVVPEVAARQHVARLPGIVRRAFQEANLGWADVDAIAVTHGPGLASSLLVGLTAAKTLALRMGKTLLPVNHLEGHVCSLFLGDAAIDSTQACPMLVLLVTGGHTCLIGVERPGVYRMLGRTLDDAAGEALDKGAKLLGLGYPGGPAIERVAATGSDSAVRFPIGTLTAKSLPRGCELDPAYCFSFSGIKTSLLYHLRRTHADIQDEVVRANLAASYQYAIFDALVRRVDRALAAGPWRTFGCVGGVARNKILRHRLMDTVAHHDVELHVAEPQFCTDNAAMIAAVPCFVEARRASVERPVTIDVMPGLALA